MDFSKYTTQELASIASKFDDLKRELEIRNNEGAENVVNSKLSVKYQNKLCLSVFSI